MKGKKMKKILVSTLGFLLSLPVSANIGPQGFGQFSNYYFIETGTYGGAGLQKAIESSSFTEFRSIEYKKSHYNSVIGKFAHNPNVRIVLGDSSVDLWKLIEYIDKPATFWLDAHVYPPRTDGGKNCPLIEELEQISWHPIKTHTILIDDMHCAGTEAFDFLSKQDIIDKLKEINPDYQIYYVPGGDRGEYPQNVMVAIVSYASRVIHETVFSQIYANAVWGKNDQGEGFSGGGSLLENCREYNRLLEKFMHEHNIKTVVDAGCGDWESTRYINWDGIEYFGFDVVKSVIDKNINRYSTSNIHFFHENLIAYDLPPADLLICKHVLQHLTNEDIKQFIPQLKKYKYCLITNEVYPTTLSSDNPDIKVGGGHKIDLRKAPFFVQGEVIFNYRIGNACHQILLIKN